MRISDWSADVCSSDLPKAESDIGILGGIFRRLIQRDFGKADLAFAGSAKRFEADALMAEMKLRQLIHAVAVLSRIKVKAHDHCVIERRDVEVQTAQNAEVIFDVVADLQHAVVAEQRLESGYDEVKRQLLRRIAEHVSAAMADRDITGSVRANRKADAGQAPRDGIEAISLRVNGKDALGISSGNPAVEIGLGRHCFILAAVNGRGRVQPGRFWFGPRCGWQIGRAPV